jgi:hypothetical protein
MSIGILYLSILLYIFHAQHIQSSIQLFLLLFLLLKTCFGLKRPSSGVVSTSKLSHCIKCSLIYTPGNSGFTRHVGHELAYCNCPEWLWGWKIWWNEDLQGKAKNSKKDRHIATLSTTKPTRPDPGSNPVRRGEKPATNRLSYGAALYTRKWDDSCLIYLMYARIHWCSSCIRVKWYILEHYVPCVFLYALFIMQDLSYM